MWLISNSTRRKTRSVLQEVRIIPRNGIYVVHLAYKEANRYDARTVGLDSARILGIDLGVTNFATMTAVGPDTENLYPLIAKGGRLKALNPIPEQAVCRTQKP